MILHKYFHIYGIEMLAFFYTTVTICVDGVEMDFEPPDSGGASDDYGGRYADVIREIDELTHRGQEIGQEINELQHRQQLAPNLQNFEEYEIQVLFPTYGYCSASSHCVGHNVECNLRLSRCVCQQFYQDNGTGICQACPFEGDPCLSCCSEIGVACINGYCKRCFTEDGRSLCNNDALLIVTISQIALSTALIMGIAALVVLWYRMCTRTNYFASNYLPQDPEHICARNYSCGSLNSVQVRIMARLRDRPPMYETNESYDSRLQREQIQNTTIPYTRDSQLNADIRIIATAPPSYDGGLLSINEQPPSYVESNAISQASNAVATIPVIPVFSTYVNDGYVATTAEQQQQRTETNSIKTFSEICVIGDSEKTVHM